MRLLIKQRIIAWSDTYDIYDEKGEVKYFVAAKIIAMSHQLYVYDKEHREVGVVKERLFQLLPVFDIEMNGVRKGSIRKKFSFACPKYEVDFNGWRVEGECFGLEYDVYQGSNCVVHISKELFAWGDTYVLDFADPADELMGLLLVIAIDAANCTE